MLFVVVMALDIVSSKYDLERDCCPCGVLLLCYKIFIPTEFLSPLIQLSATRDKHADDVENKNMFELFKTEVLKAEWQKRIHSSIFMTHN